MEYHPKILEVELYDTYAKRDKYTFRFCCEEHINEFSSKYDEIFDELPSKRQFQINDQYKQYNESATEKHENDEIFMRMFFILKFNKDGFIHLFCTSIHDTVMNNVVIDKCGIYTKNKDLEFNSTHCWNCRQDLEGKRPVRSGCIIINEDRSKNYGYLRRYICTTCRDEFKDILLNKCFGCLKYEKNKDTFKKCSRCEVAFYCETCESAYSHHIANCP